MPFLFYDKTMIFILIGMAIAGLASMYMRSTFEKYNRVPNMRGITGEMAAAEVLRRAGLNHVRIEHVRGELSDHYDPRQNILRLSQSTYGKASIGAVGVAIHECGHAVQDAKSYGPMLFRAYLVPIANFGGQLSWPIFLAGLFLSMPFLLDLGILLFLGTVAFHLITLPVEFDASFRAVRLIRDANLLTEEELRGVKKVLFAAALTYVAGFLSVLLNLLRLIVLAGGRRRD